MIDTPSLGSCWAKVDRANENIFNLDREIRAFIENGPYELIPDDFFQALKTKYKRWRVVSVKNIPPSLAVLTGEVVHHLRSSLDLMIFQLIRKNTGTDPIRLTDVQFPVLLHKPKTTEERDSNFRRKIKGVSSSAEARIEALQPYNAPYSSVLYALHKLNIIDKHRLLLTMISTLWVPEHLLKEAERYKAISARTHSLKVGEFIVSHIFADAAMQEAADFTFDITFGETGLVNGEAVIPALKYLSGFVSHTLSSFDEEF